MDGENGRRMEWIGLEWDRPIVPVIIAIIIIIEYPSPINYQRALIIDPRFSDMEYLSST